MDEWLRKCASTAGGTSWSLFRELRTHSNVVQSKKDKFGLASLVGSTHHHRVVWGKWGKRWKVVSVAPSGCGCLWPPVPFPCTSALYSCPVCPLEQLHLRFFAHGPFIPQSLEWLSASIENKLSFPLLFSFFLTEIFFPLFWGCREHTALLVRF